MPTVLTPNGAGFLLAATAHRVTGEALAQFAERLHSDGLHSQAAVAFRFPDSGNTSYVGDGFFEGTVRLRVVSPDGTRALLVSAIDGVGIVGTATSDFPAPGFANAPFGTGLHFMEAAVDNAGTATLLKLDGVDRLADAPSSVASGGDVECRTDIYCSAYHDSSATADVVCNVGVDFFVAYDFIAFDAGAGDYASADRAWYESYYVSAGSSVYSGWDASWHYANSYIVPGLGSGGEGGGGGTGHTGPTIVGHRLERFESDDLFALNNWFNGVLATTRKHLFG